MSRRQSLQDCLAICNHNWWAELRNDSAVPCLERKRPDFAGAVEGIRHGYEDVKSRRTRLTAEFLANLLRKHDLPRHS